MPLMVTRSWDIFGWSDPIRQAVILTFGSERLVLQRDLFRNGFRTPSADGKSKVLKSILPHSTAKCYVCSFVVVLGRSVLNGGRGTSGRGVPIEIPVNYKSRSFSEGKKIKIFSDPWTWLWAIIKYRVLSPTNEVIYPDWDDQTKQFVNVSDLHE